MKNRLLMGTEEIDCSSRVYREMLNKIPGGVIEYENDAQYTVIALNDTFLQMFGYSQEEISKEFHFQYINMVALEDRASLQARVKKSSHDKSFQLNYRVICKDGSSKWVADNWKYNRRADGEEVICSVLADISDIKEIKSELRLSLERQQILLEHTADIIFQWDIKKDAIFFSANLRKKFGYDSIVENAAEKVLASTYVYKNDRSRLRQIYHKVLAGTPVITEEFRLQTVTGQYIWCSVHIISQLNEGQVVKALGIIKDVHKEKQLIEKLRHRAERDALTGLYHKKEAEMLIKQSLEELESDKLAALMIIDTDNFKMINDTKGHLFGDALLLEISAEMNKLIRSSDVVGRIGGDEFIVFLKNLSSPRDAEQKAEILIQMFRSLFISKKQDMQVTASIGISIYPNHGKYFQELYQCADQALYTAKGRGKNQYMTFRDSEEMDFLSCEQVYAEYNGDTESFFHHVSNDLLQCAFETLYETKDVSKVIQCILETAGRQYDVSRAYVFENTADNCYTNNIFEWCREMVAPQMSLLQNVNFKKLENRVNQFDDRGIFYCADVTELPEEQKEILTEQGIQAVLQYAIIKKNQICGFVGFDECTGKRLWTYEEINTLSFIAQMVAALKDLENKKKTDR